MGARRYRPAALGRVVSEDAMTPLIVVPARQMSEGRPCKNRDAWPALQACIDDLPRDWPLALVLDDPMLPRLRPNAFTIYCYADRTATVAAKVQLALVGQLLSDEDVVVVLQPSSPTEKRAAYVRAAVDHLATHPDHTSVTGVVRWEGTPPTKACHLTDDGFLQVPPVEARQAHRPAFRRDGTIYCVRAEYARAGDLYGPRPVPLLIDPRDSQTLD